MKQLHILKNLGLVVMMMLISSALFAQGSISGQLIDQETDEGLIGASVLVKGTTKGTITDYDGKFTIEGLDAGSYELTMSYTGYGPMEQTVEVANGTNDLGTIKLAPEAIGLSEVMVIAAVAVDRKTPVAVTTIKGEKIEALVGNQEYPEILRKTPSIYVTKEGGGFGDARINVRGFDQTNIAVMINGIPVNDMENGRVFWSNWAGLADVTSNLQIQRGLGATKLATPSVGGSINIITNAAEMRKGAKVSLGFGNDGYQKYGVALNSGLMDNGWAFSAMFTHTRGDGYVDGTKFRAYSYYLAATKNINDKHSISLTALGAPQWHHQRLTASRFDNISLRTFVDPDNTPDDLANGERYNRGIKFNNTWGMLNGEEFNFRRNFYHKPKVYLNHYWTINEKTSLKTSAYVSFGRGGGTGPRGRLRTPGSVFDSFNGFGQGIHDENGQIRFDDIVRYNQGQAVEGWGDAKSAENGQFIVTSDGRFTPEGGTRNDNGSGFIRRASMNSHNWYGMLSTLTSELSENLTLTAGIDGRFYKGIHYRRVENLLGADAYIARSDDNNPVNVITETAAADFGSFSDNSYKDGNNVLNYWNDGLVSWLGLFGQLEYSNGKTSAFASASVSNQGFKRVDYFNYLDSDPLQETDWENHLAGTIKAGVNYNIDDQNNVYFNAGFISRAPIFDNVFINFVNEVNPDIKNQSIYSAEAGYGFRTRNFTAKVNAYYTLWTNRQFDVGLPIAVNDTTINDGLALFNDVGQEHIGLELELSYSPIPKLTIDGMLSVGNWEYSKDFTARITNLDTGQPEGELVIFGEGEKVGDAAQTTFSIGANYEIVDGLRVYADYYMAADLYANVDIQDDIFQTASEDLPDYYDGRVAKLPSYSLVDAGVSYNFDL